MPSIMRERSSIPAHMRMACEFSTGSPEQPDLFSPLREKSAGRVQLPLSAPTNCEWVTCFYSLLLSSVCLITSHNNSLGNFSMARGVFGIDVLAGPQRRAHFCVVEKY